jgi:putative tricarboxylic transport membrane protein
MTDANPWLFLTRPISGTLLVLALLSFILAIYQERRYLKKKQGAS